MEIYSLNRIVCMFASAGSDNLLFILQLSLVIGGGLFAALFILQGMGVYKMAKARNFKRKWLAFIPFANLCYLGKLAGECRFFSSKVKHAGVFAMIAQLVSVLLSCAYLFIEWYLYDKYGKPLLEDSSGFSYWGLQGVDGRLEWFYRYGEYFLSIGQLVTQIAMFILCVGIYKKYAPRNHSMLGLLTLFVPVSRFIILFVLRNRVAIDYEAYVRRRNEEFIRRQQQYYNTYGNPYGNAYGGNPYRREGGVNGQSNAPQQEEPFGEFSSSSKGEKKEEEGGGFFDEPNSGGFFD